MISMLVLSLLPSVSSLRFDSLDLDLPGSDVPRILLESIAEMEGEIATSLSGSYLAFENLEREKELLEGVGLLTSPLSERRKTKRFLDLVDSCSEREEELFKLAEKQPGNTERRKVFLEKVTSKKLRQRISKGLKYLLKVPRRKTRIIGKPRALKSSEFGKKNILKEIRNRIRPSHEKNITANYFSSDIFSEKKQFSVVGNFFCPSPSLLEIEKPFCPNLITSKKEIIFRKNGAGKRENVFFDLRRLDINGEKNDKFIEKTQNTSNFHLFGLHSTERKEENKTALIFKNIEKYSNQTLNQTDSLAGLSETPKTAKTKNIKTVKMTKNYFNSPLEVFEGWPFHDGNVEKVLNDSDLYCPGNQVVCRGARGNTSSQIENIFDSSAKISNISHFQENITENNSTIFVSFSNNSSTPQNVSAFSENPEKILNKSEFLAPFEDLKKLDLDFNFFDDGGGISVPDLISRLSSELLFSLNFQKKVLSELSFVKQAGLKMGDQMRRLREALRKSGKIKRDRAGPGMLEGMDNSKMRLTWLTENGLVEEHELRDFSGDSFESIFPVEDFSGNNKLFPDFDCDQKNSKLNISWSSFRKIFEMEASIEWLQLSVPFLDQISGFSFSEYSTAEKVCPLGVATAHVLWFVKCFLEGNKGCMDSHSQDVLRTIRRTPLRILAGTRWPLFSILSSQTLKGTPKNDSCEGDQLINWTKFRSNFQFPLKPSWFFGAVDFVFSNKIEQNLEHAMKKCKNGFLTAIIIKLLLCASSESACYDTYEHFFLQEISEGGRVQNLTDLIDSSWPIFWMLNHLHRVRRHQFRLDFLENELKGPLASPSPPAEGGAVQTWWARKRSRPYTDLMSALLSGELSNKRTVYVSQVWGGTDVLDVLPLWIARWKAVFLAGNSSDAVGLVLLTSDRKTYDECSLLLPWRCIRAKRSKLHRFTLPLALVNLGFDAVWVDFDVYPVRDPTTPLLSALYNESADGLPVDILVGGSFESSCVCNGIVYFRSNPVVSRWLVSLLRWLYTHPYEHDQKACAAFLGNFEKLSRFPLPMPAQKPKFLILDSKNQFISLKLNERNFENSDGGWTGNLTDIVTVHWRMKYARNKNSFCEMTALQEQSVSLVNSTNATLKGRVEGGVEKDAGIESSALPPPSCPVLEERDFFVKSLPLCEARDDEAVSSTLREAERELVTEAARRKVQSLLSCSSSSLPPWVENVGMTRLGGETPFLGDGMGELDLGKKKIQVHLGFSNSSPPPPSLSSVFYPSPSSSPSASKLYSQGMEGIKNAQIRTVVLASYRIRRDEAMRLEKCTNFELDDYEE